MQINIGYEFRNIEELSDFMGKLNDFSTAEIVYLVLIVLVIPVLILYGLPILNLYLETRKRNKEIESKKIALRQIIIQKEIEEDVEREIKAEDEKEQGIKSQ